MRGLIILKIDKMGYRTKMILGILGTIGIVLFQYMPESWCANPIVKIGLFIMGGVIIGFVIYLIVRICEDIGDYILRRKIN
jgi:hypothetical protein